MNAETVSPEYIYHCKKLLLEHEKAWLDYQKQLSIRTSPGISSQATTGKSSFIQWQDSVYNSQDNKSTGNCLWDASKPHQKCKCRQLYVPGQDHLHAPCSNTEGGPQLTFDVCKKLGYLEPERDDSIPVSAIKPVWPVVSCDQCREYFEALQFNFNPHNYQQVVNCIAKLGQKHVNTSTTLDPKLSKSIGTYTKWFALALFVVLLLTGFISYKLYKGAFQKAKFCKT